MLFCHSGFAEIDEWPEMLDLANVRRLRPDEGSSEPMSSETVLVDCGVIFGGCYAIRPLVLQLGACMSSSFTD